MTKYIIGLISAAVFFLIGFLLLWAETWYFENQLDVSPFAGTSQQDWLQNFSDVAYSQLGTALVFTLAWHSIGYWYYKIDRWQKAGGRLVWTALFVFMLIVVASIGWTYTYPTQDSGKVLAVGAYLLNAVFIYYGSSFFSPTTVKYVAPGAMRVNRIWS
ncbi:MAG: hypothetical protein IPL32_03700 [Chloracidobacterium sp.]|nr:hypothetical protein [Chloracidobacterium sp.]